MYFRKCLKQAAGFTVLVVLVTWALFALGQVAYCTDARSFGYCMVHTFDKGDDIRLGA